MRIEIGRRWVVSIATACGLAAVATVTVRAEAPPGRYGALTQGTIQDTETALVWQATPAGNDLDWAGAGAYCSSNQAGLPGTGWRLPSMKELQTLVDETTDHPAIDTKVFPIGPTDDFWSSTPSFDDPAKAWFVRFSTGESETTTQATYLRVRCVR